MVAAQYPDEYLAECAGSQFLRNASDKSVILVSVITVTSIWGSPLLNEPVSRCQARIS